MSMDSWLDTKQPAFETIDLKKLFLYQSIYTTIDALLLHPFTVAQTVAENNEKFLSLHDQRGSLTQRTQKSLNNNLKISQALKKLITASTNTAHPHIGINSHTVRACYVGLPVLGLYLFLFDALQFYPQVYLTEKIELPHSVAAGLNASVILLFSLPLTNIFRHQVYLKCQAKPHSVLVTLNHILGSNGTGLHNNIKAKIGNLYRGFYGCLAGIPHAALSWGIYEKTKKIVQEKTGSTHVATTMFSGGVAGGIGVILLRPLAAVIAKKQLEPIDKPYLTIIKRMWYSEGPGAFMKGLSARLCQAIPRMGIFYSAYSLCVTWSMRTNEKN